MTFFSVPDKLIPVFEYEIANELQLVVDARVLHEYLKVKVDFTLWIEERLKQFQFLEDLDFKVSKNIRADSSATLFSFSDTCEYYLTLDVAKELSIIENTLQGSIARRYFIACEKLFRKVESSLIIQLYSAQRELEAVSQAASQAGRALNILGKKIKPKCKQKVDSLKQMIQPDLLNVDTLL